MSLDVYLTTPVPQKVAPAIYVRENGGTVQLTPEEWAERNPDSDPVMMAEDETNKVFSANITHNLNSMAAEAGIYEALWRPDEVGITKAEQLVEPLAKGLALLKAEPERFTPFNPPNGWGSYEVFVPWIERYLEACRENPDADIGVWR